MGSLRFFLLQTPFLILLCVRYHGAVVAAEEQLTYNNFSGANLTLDGMAAVAPNGLLVLSNGTSEAAGHAFHPTPLRMRNGTTLQSFSVAFVFAILSKFNVLSDNGMAFVIAPSTTLSTFNTGQYLGILNVTDNGKADNQVFAVELDTMFNPEFQDMNSNHIGVDVNSMRSVLNQSAGYYDDATGEFNSLTLNSRKPMQVWVDYDGASTRLDVTMAPLDVPRPKRPLISAPVNLSAVVADTAYVGFSAATGVVYTRHYVLGWSFALNGAAPPLDTSKLPPLPRFGAKPRPMVLVIVLSIAAVALVFALAIACFLFVRARGKQAEVPEDWEVDLGPKRFSWRELHKATKGFDDGQLLGTGGFGKVYKGIHPKSNREIAVKRVSPESKQGEKEFVAEVVSLSSLWHRNLVQLIGYGSRHHAQRRELLLVYDFMPNGGLDRHLHNRSMPVLDWGKRLRIILGVASGLLYLHEDGEKVVVHRDIKASNVLLDGDMNGRLGDFGLARLYDHGMDPQTTSPAGTLGCLAPELLRTRKATTATDVFAFGVFVLEVVCGRRPVDRLAPDDQAVLLDWVQEHERRGAALDTVDPRLSGMYDADKARMAIKLALMCAHQEPDARPGMRQVTLYLEEMGVVMPAVQTIPRQTTMAPVQNDGFDSFAVANHVSDDVSAVSGLSGGR